MKLLTVLILLAFVDACTAPAAGPVRIDAFDMRAWSGLGVEAPNGNHYYVKFGFQKGDRVVEGNEVFYNVRRVGPHAPDGSYARLDIRVGESPEETVTLEWARLDEHSAVGRLTARTDCDITATTYPTPDSKFFSSVQTDGLIGMRSFTRSSAHARCAFLLEGAKNRWLKTALHPTERVGRPMKAGEQAYFCLSVSSDCEDEVRGQLEDTKALDVAIDARREAYAASRVQVTGAYAGAAEALTNSVHWMIAYKRDTQVRYIPAGRTWQLDTEPKRWTVFEWDSFFNALETSVEDKALTYEILEAVLSAQYPNGNVPNWRGSNPDAGSPDRSQPPVGSYAIWKIYNKFGKDATLLENTYTRLVKWHRWWLTDGGTGYPRRDGNTDGLLEWGSDVGIDFVEAKEPDRLKRAMFESGMDDSPLWEEATFDDKRWVMNLNALDLNCLYALDAWCLSKIAGTLGRTEDAAQFMAEYDALKDRINERMWNEEAGFYFDQRWGGRLSSRKAASSFYPLLAGIPSAARAMRMLEHLKNEQEFWGSYVVPTISRDDPLYEDMQYWRGTIWPPTNYLVCEGLKRYGFEAEASAVARKGFEMFMVPWRQHNHCRENYNSLTGEGGANQYQSWGGLFCLMPLESFADVDHEGDVRFGCGSPAGASTASNLWLGGRRYKVSLGPEKLFVIENDLPVFEIRGTSRVRSYRRDGASLSFTYAAEGKGTLFLYSDKPDDIRLSIDGKEVVRSQRREKDAAIFILPSGSHVLVATYSELET